MTTLVLTFALLSGAHAASGKPDGEWDHIKVCKFGKECRRVDCYFRHPSQPNGCKFAELCERMCCEDEHETASIFQAAPAPAPRRRGTHRQEPKQKQRRRKTKGACKHGMKCQRGDCWYKHPMHPLLDGVSYDPSEHTKTCPRGHPLQEFMIPLDSAKYSVCVNAYDPRKDDLTAWEDSYPHMYMEHKGHKGVCLSLYNFRSRRRDWLDKDDGNSSYYKPGSIVYTCRFCQNAPTPKITGNHYLDGPCDVSFQTTEGSPYYGDAWFQAKFLYCRDCYDADRVPFINDVEYQSDDSEDY